MGYPIFPTLRGQGWSVFRRPTTSTKVAAHVSGREVRVPLFVNPLYEFEVSYEGLTSRQAFPGLDEVEILQGFILACGGQFSPFVYVDPDANAAKGQVIGTGDGTTTTFTLQRRAGRAFTQPIDIATAITAVRVFPPGGYADYGFVVADAVATTADYGNVTSAATLTVDYGTTAPAFAASTWTQVGNNAVTLPAPPAFGATVTADFTYGFLCRFMDDQFELEKVMQGVWKTGSIKFKTFR